MMLLNNRVQCKRCGSKNTNTFTKNYIWGNTRKALKEIKCLDCRKFTIRWIDIK